MFSIAFPQSQLLLHLQEPVDVYHRIHEIAASLCVPSGCGREAMCSSAHDQGRLLTETAREWRARKGRVPDRHSGVLRHCSSPRLHVHAFLGFTDLGVREVPVLRSSQA